MQSEETTAKLALAGLNLIQQALSIYDSDLRLAVCNRRFQEMFDLPQALVTPGAPFRGHDPLSGRTRRIWRRRRPRSGSCRTGSTRPAPSSRITWNAPAPTAARSRSKARPCRRAAGSRVYTDITEIKRQEALLRARSEELSEQVLAHAEELAQTNRELAATNAALEEAKRELTEMEARTRLTTEMMPAHIAHAGPRPGATPIRTGACRPVMPGGPSNIVGLTRRRGAGGRCLARGSSRMLDRACDGEASVFEFTARPPAAAASASPSRPNRQPMARSTASISCRWT